VTTVTPTARAALEEALADFFRASRRARGRAARKSPAGGLSLAQFHALEPLMDGPLAVCRVAEEAGIAAPTATRLLDGLVERGYASREPDAADRRSVLVSLTPAGRSATRRKLKEVEAARARIAAVLDEDEQRVAADLLRRLADVIEEL
jgi:MarR family transcriptional regulator, organic hydroperoxide resistance regulator